MGSCSGQRHLLTAPTPPIGPSVAPCLWWCASQPSPWAELCVEASPALPGDGHPVTRPSRAMSCRSAEIHGGALLRSRRFSTSLDTRASSRVIRPEKSGVSSRPSRKGMCVCAFEHWLQMSIYIYMCMYIYIYMYIYMSLVKWCEISIPKVSKLKVYWKSWDWLQWRTNLVTWHRFKTIFAEWLENHRSWARYLQQQVDFFHLQLFRRPRSSYGSCI